MPKSLTLPEIGFVREPVVLAHVGLGRTKWRQLVAAGAAPSPRQLGPRCVMYDATAVRAWIVNQAATAPIVRINSGRAPAAAQAAAHAAS
jgi:predicted DNA-binding transcriptional regulator AlpA